MRIKWSYIFILCLLGFIALPSVFNPIKNAIYTPHTNKVLEAPTWEHLLGTDTQGRDYLVRLLYGASLSLWMSILINIIGIIIGTLAGLMLFIMIRQFGMQIIESLLAIPWFVLGGILSILFGTSILSLIISFGLMMALPYAYMTQSYIVKEIQTPFIKRAQFMGRSLTFILFFHILPIIKNRIYYQSLINIHSTIFALASMTFLGFGLKAPTPEWGSFIYEALPYISTNPLLIIDPFGLFILLAWCIYTINDFYLSKIEALYPKLKLQKDKPNYLVAQLESFPIFLKSALQIQGNNSQQIALQEDYHFNFPKAYTIKEFLQDLLNGQYKDKEEQIKKILHTLELNENVINAYPRELSGGMLQRLSLIMALILSPEKLFLESPCSSLNTPLKHKAFFLLLEQYHKNLFITAPFLDIPDPIKNHFEPIIQLYQNHYQIYQNTLKQNIVLIGKPSKQILIEWNNIQPHYSVPSLNNKKMQVYKKEILGIVGYSGIGKTTLAKMISGFLLISTGTLQYDKPLKTDIISQDPSEFNPYLTIKKILLEFIPHKKIRKQILIQTLQKLDLGASILQKKMKDLSKAHQYQVLLLRSLIYCPDLMILDELLDHIPYEKYNQVINLLDQTRIDYSTSIVLISHKQDLLYQIADRVITLTND